MKTTEPRVPLDSPETSGRSTLDWAVEAGLAGEVLRALAARRRRRRIGGALGVAALLALATWTTIPRLDAPGPEVASIVVQPQRQVLADGSVAELGEDAVMRVEFSAVVRRVVLERGVAHFTVMKNPARPFVVAAGRLEVRAVGTAFAVDRGADGIEVVVTEGRVAVKSTDGSVAAASPADAVATLVGAGERVMVEGAGSPAGPATGGWAVDRLTPEELAETQAWRIPRLEFSGTPLAEALPLFNRHSSRQLVLAAPDLGLLRLSGVIRADNTEALLRLLKANFGIVAEAQTNGEIVLRPGR